MHTHEYAHVGVILTKGSLVFTDPAGKVETVAFDSGSVGFREAKATHRVGNPGARSDACDRSGAEVVAPYGAYQLTRTRYLRIDVPSCATGTWNCAAHASVFVHWCDADSIRHDPAIGSFTCTATGAGFVVPQGDLEGHLVDVVGNPFEVYLLAFAYDVERAADLDRDVLVLGRVVDVILAGELHAALRVGLVDADGARRQRHAEDRPLRRF